MPTCQKSASYCNLGASLSRFLTLRTDRDNIIRICMESSGHNRANISPPNCNKMLILGTETKLEGFVGVTRA